MIQLRYRSKCLMLHIVRFSSFCRKMGKARGVNSGGGESSLGYLFGSGESVSKPNKPTANTSFTTTTTTTNATTTGDKNKTEEEEKKEMSAGVRGSPNNYLRTEGQNCGNFLTDRPSTKVHAAPGGGSSLGYLFGSGSGK
ncbi:unnamed protein product [Eruca vesicaria subsp. sativa]|uniref:Uncharacterized protein n=1 Tax=Eruca vesicaria subsp. sativa TaxID=29727 RepID=A0ABC8JJ07_ERUVS|nr:unnamed protein product [Eruca vesicaria subsp. sativa]